MKKKYIQLGVAALVLAVLAGALVFLRNEPETVEATSEAPAVNTIYVYGDAETEDTAPKQIDVSNEFGDITIDNITPEGALPANVELTIRGWEKLSLDTYGLGQASSNAKSMRAKEIIAETATAEELKAFGLDNPRASITVHLQNGDKPVVLFGASAPGGEGVYVKTENKDVIYLISDTMASPYFKPATAYVNKTITATDPEYKGFDRITLSGTNYPEQLVIERTPENEISGAGIVLNTHSFTSPIIRNVDGQRGLEPLYSVYGLLANDVVAVDDSAETLEKYGLLDPHTVISVTGTTPEMTFTLRISDTDENGEVHLIKDGSKVIYELSTSALPFLGKSLFDMMDKMVIVPNIKTVSRVFLMSEGKSYDFVLTQDEEAGTLEVTANGVPIPDVIDETGAVVATGGENFRKLYQTMLACRYDEPIPKDESSEDLPAGTLPAPHMTDSETGEVFLAEQDTGTSDVPEAEAGVVETAESQLPPGDTTSPFIASFEYFYNSGRDSDVVSFYGGPPRKVEIFLNGDSGYYGQSAYVDRLFEDAEKVINGIAVKAYL